MQVYHNDGCQEHAIARAPATMIGLLIAIRTCPEALVSLVPRTISG